MKRVVWKSVIGQMRAREVLGAAVERGTLGHAYLFCGAEGVGTFACALELANALLCERDDAPCGECEGCRKVRNHTHPNLSIVAPVSLSKEHRGTDSSLSEKGWEFLSHTVEERIASPYVTPDAAGVRQIPVEWIREVNHAIQRGPIDGRANIAILCGVEFMQKESANAMLKTLEEPPQGCVMLLCTESPQSVLPTIQSRCQVVRFGQLSPEEVAQGLARDGAELDDAGRAFVIESAQGDLGSAIVLSRDPHPEAVLDARRLWQLVEQEDTVSLVGGVDELNEKLGAGACEQVFMYCMHIVRNAMVLGEEGTGAYVPAGTGLVPPGGVALDAGQARALLALCQRSVRAVRARGSLPLVLMGFVDEAREIVHGEE